jgi:hypothetical protein
VYIDVIPCLDNDVDDWAGGAGADAVGEKYGSNNRRSPGSTIWQYIHFDPADLMQITGATNQSHC